MEKPNMADIVEVKEITGQAEVNRLLQGSWRLLDTRTQDSFAARREDSRCPQTETVYVLGRPANVMYR